MYSVFSVLLWFIGEGALPQPRGRLRVHAVPRGRGRTRQGVHLPPDGLPVRGHLREVLLVWYVQITTGY